MTKIHIMECWAHALCNYKKKIYLSEKDNKELYEAQPTEQSSHYLDIPVAAGLFKSLKQNN